MIFMLPAVFLFDSLLSENTEKSTAKSGNKNEFLLHCFCFEYV